MKLETITLNPSWCEGFELRYELIAGKVDGTVDLECAICLPDGEEISRHHVKSTTVDADADLYTIAYELMECYGFDSIDEELEKAAEVMAESEEQVEEEANVYIVTLTAYKMDPEIYVFSEKHLAEQFLSECRAADYLHNKECELTESNINPKFVDPFEGL